jgi:hypothetical protein
MGRLHTMDKFYAYQIISSLICILCGSHIETHDHMFFHCPFSASIWGLPKEDSYKLSFYDMTTFALVDIHALYAEEGIYASICSVTTLSHNLLYLA